MPVTDWNVRVGLKTHQVAVDIDPQSSKALIRVDGKMAARPLAPHESERQFSIDSQPYILRRMEDGSFDLDIGFARAVEEGAVPPPRMPLAAAKAAPERPLKKIIVQTLIGIVILGGLAYGRKLYKHWSADWHDYIPPDHTYKVSFPGPETTEERTISAGDRSYTLTSVSARNDDHEYGVAHFDLPGAIPEPQADPVFSAGILAMVEKRGGTIVRKENTVFAHHYAQSFVATIPETDKHPERSIRGSICIDGQRIYIVMVIVPAGDALAYDVGQFLRSFYLPD